MSLEVKALDIPDVKLITVKKFGDHRGFFSETYNAQSFAEAGINLQFVQDNHSRSMEKGTVRGLHFQGHPYAQDKLVRVVRGRILDVAVDLRKSSPTFGKWIAAEISADLWNQILVPVGFGHGICTLESDTEIIYKVTNVYSPKHDFGLLWNDPDLNIAWPSCVNVDCLSEKDKKQPRFRDLQTFFD